MWKKVCRGHYTLETAVGKFVAFKLTHRGEPWWTVELDGVDIDVSSNTFRVVRHRVEVLLSGKRWAKRTLYQRAR